MKTSTLLQTLLITALAFSGSVASHAATQTAAKLLDRVDTTNGVSRAEATNIAQAYFLRNVGCGNFSGISEAPESWVVEGKFGYAGKPIRGFFINKKTGAITSPVGPSYAHPKDMLGPNNSFNPTAEVGLVINKQTGPAAG